MGHRFRLMKRSLPLLFFLFIMLRMVTPVSAASANVYPLQEGLVDAHGALIYYVEMGHGSPLLIVHGGPGASHEYFLPWLLPLARTNRLIFIDERGSGRSERVEDVHQYTVENMVEDVEAVRRVGLRNCPVLTDDRHVFIVVVGRCIPKIMTAGYNDAVVGEWIDNDDFVVNDRVTRLVQLSLPLAEGIVPGDR